MRRALAILVAVLFALWLGSVAVLLLFVAGLASVPSLIGAIVVQLGVFGVAVAVLLVTNTRRPRGVDPDAPAPSAAGVMLPDGLPYGRRARDDRSVVDRLSEVLEEEAARRPGPARTPEWAIGLARDAGQVEIADERKAEEYES